MQIHLTSDGPPIYQQIAEQIRHRILSQTLRTGDELPTIRGLAETLRVNPNTIQRAYRELEQEGLVEKRRTRGTFVAQRAPREGIRQRRETLLPHVDKLLAHANGLGFELDDVIELMKKRHENLAKSGAKK